MQKTSQLGKELAFHLLHDKVILISLKPPVVDACTCLTPPSVILFFCDRYSVSICHF